MQGAGKVADPRERKRGRAFPTYLSPRQTEGQTDRSMWLEGGLGTELEGVDTGEKDKRERPCGGR